MKRLAATAIAFSLLGATAALAAPPVQWVPVWAAPPTPTSPNNKSFENQTVRQVIRVSAGGKRVRVRLSNEYGAKPLVIGAASLGNVGGKPIALTFNGKTSVTIPPNAPMYSDPVALPVKALEMLSVSLFFPEKTGPCTCHLTGAQTASVSGPGDFTKGDFTPTSTFINRAFLTEVDVEPNGALPVLVTFGDSITDGYNSTVDGNHRWPDVLAERLGGKIAVVPQAISGNQIRGMGQAMFGESALTRLDRDLLSVPGVKWVTVLEGINDLGMNRGAARPGFEEMINGYRQIVDRAHAHGLKIFGATLLPYEGAAYFSPEGEATRQQINAWMRSKDSFFDGLIDFDKVMADPAHPTKMRPEQQSGDWLHPNDAGYKVMGQAVDLKLFR
jgi:lysophospholipase L1-like esterase